MPFSGGFGFGLMQPGGAYSAPIAAARARDPRYLIANTLIQGAGDTSPVQSPWQGVSRLAQGALSGYLMNRAESDFQNQQADYTRVMGNALMKMQGSPAETKTYGDGTTINWNPVAPDIAGGLKELASNPYTAGTAQQFQFQQIMAAQKARQDMLDSLRKERLTLDAQGNIVPIPRYAELAGQAKAAEARPMIDVEAEKARALIPPKVEELKALIPAQAEKAGAVAAAEAPFKTTEVGPGGSIVAPFAGPGATPKTVATSPYPPSSMVNVNMGGEPAFEQEYGKERAKQAASIYEEANTASKRRDNIRAFRVIMGEVATGRLAPAAGEVSAALEAIGIDPKSLNLGSASGPQALEAIQRRLAVSNIGPGGLPANNFSEADRKYIDQMEPSLRTSLGANKIILDIEEAKAARAMIKDDMWERAREEGKSFEQFKRRWREYADKNPLFTDDLKAEIQRLANNPGSSGLPAPKTAEEAAKLPRGTRFIAPDGTERVVP